MRTPSPTHHAVPRSHPPHPPPPRERQSNGGSPAVPARPRPLPAGGVRVRRDPHKENGSVVHRSRGPPAGPPSFLHKRPSSQYYNSSYRQKPRHFPKPLVPQGGLRIYAREMAEVGEGNLGNVPSQNRPTPKQPPNASLRRRNGPRALAPTRSPPSPTPHRAKLQPLCRRAASAGHS